MPDVIDINDALRMYLPKTLLVPPNETVPIAWHLHDKLPNEREYPYGTIELLNTSPRGPSRKQTRYATQVLIATSSAIAFTTGTLSYLLVQQDVEDIQSVTGTVSGAPHTFVQGTDYELSADDKTIVWLGATLPDNATNFTVNYRHRKYRRRFGMDGSVSVRLHVVTKDYTGASRKYDKSQMGWLLNLAMEHYLRLNAGKVLSKPPNTAPTPYHLEAAAGDFLSSNKEYVDPSEGVISYSLDFKVNASYIVQRPEVEAILTLGITPEILP